MIFRPNYFHLNTLSLERRLFADIILIHMCLILNLACVVDCGLQKSASKFSPDAMPFTPRNIIVYATPPSLPTAVTVLSSSALSANAPEFYPKNYQSFYKVCMIM